MPNNIAFTSSLRSKLILMAAIPALALLYFAGSGVLERQSTSKEMAKLESLVDVSVKIGALVHEMQKERGMSASFIGSNGVKFAAELPAQRAKTDKAVETFQTTLKSFDAGSYSDGLKTLLDAAVSNLGELTAKRDSHQRSRHGWNAIECLLQLKPSAPCSMFLPKSPRSVVTAKFPVWLLRIQVCLKPRSVPAWSEPC